MGIKRKKMNVNKRNRIVGCVLISLVFVVTLALFATGCEKDGCHRLYEEACKEKCKNRYVWSVTQEGPASFTPKCCCLDD